MKKLILSLLCLIQVQSALSSATLGFVIAEFMRSGKSAIADVVTLVPYASLDDTQKATIKKLYVDNELFLDNVKGRSIEIKKEKDFEQWLLGDSFSLDVIQVNGAIVGGFIFGKRESYVYIYRLFLVPAYKKSPCAQQAVQLFEATHKYPVLKVKGDMNTVSFWHKCGFSESQDPYPELFELEKNLLSPVYHEIASQVDTKHVPKQKRFDLYLGKMNFFKNLRRVNFADVTLEIASSEKNEGRDLYNCNVLYKEEYVGFVSYIVDEKLEEKCVIVLKLNIQEKNRKKGFGKCVILRLQNDYAPQKIVAASILISSREFWEKCGFRPFSDALDSHYIKQCVGDRS